MGRVGGKAESSGVIASSHAVHRIRKHCLTLMKNGVIGPTNCIIDALTNTSIDTVIGKLAVRKEDHQGMVGSYLAEAVKLPQPRYGAAVGCKVPKVLP